MIDKQSVKFKQVAYWWDGYFIADGDAIEQAELLDSVNAFGGEHGVLNVPALASVDEIGELVNQELNQAA